MFSYELAALETPLNKKKNADGSLLLGLIRAGSLRALFEDMYGMISGVNQPVLGGDEGEVLNSVYYTCGVRYVYHGTSPSRFPMKGRSTNLHRQQQRERVACSVTTRVIGIGTIEALSSRERACLRRVVWH